MANLESLMNLECLVLTPVQAAEILQVSPEKVYQMALKGTLPGAFKLGGRWAIKRAVMEAWLKGE